MPCAVEVSPVIYTTGNTGQAIRFYEKCYQTRIEVAAEVTDGFEAFHQTYPHNELILRPMLLSQIAPLVPENKNAECTIEIEAISFSSSNTVHSALFLTWFFCGCDTPTRVAL